VALKLCTGRVSPKTAAGNTVPVSRATMRSGAAKSWDCAALAEPGQEYCAAHLRQQGLRKCPTHGWVRPEAAFNGSERVSFPGGSYPMPVLAFLYCPHRFRTQCPTEWDQREVKDIRI
jgi:hypothetical protein